MTLLLLLSNPAAAGWRDEVAAARAACVPDPAPCAVVDGLFLRTDRAGQTVAQDPRLDDPASRDALIPLVLERLLREQDPAVRRGLADAARELLSASAEAGSERWSAAWADLVSDPQAEVRAVLVDGLRRAPAAVAGPALRAAASHPAPATRADAARTMGGHANRVGFLPDLARLAGDREVAVRFEAARALRREALRGPLPPAASEALGRLRTDADPRIRALAEEALGAR